MIRTAVAVALFAATLASPAIAVPAKPVEGRVSHADLDLSNPAGVAELNQRIERAAHDLCTGELHRELWSSAEVMACQESVVASGKARLAELVAANCSQPHLAARRD